MSISEPSLDLYVRNFCTLSLFLCSFSAHSLVQPVSICFPSPSFPLLCSGMCISAGSDEIVVNRVLLCACVCVFMFHVPACSLPAETGDKECQQEKKKRFRPTQIGNNTFTGNFPPNCGWVIPRGRVLI